MFQYFFENPVNTIEETEGFFVRYFAALTKSGYHCIESFFIFVDGCCCDNMSKTGVFEINTDISESQVVFILQFLFETGR